MIQNDLDHNNPSLITSFIKSRINFTNLRTYSLSGRIIRKIANPLTSNCIKYIKAPCFLLKLWNVFKSKIVPVVYQIEYGLR